MAAADSSAPGSVASSVRVVALDHFVLRVRDLDRSLSFYRDTLGLPVEFLEEYRAGQRPFVSLRVGEQLIDLVPDATYVAPPQSGFLHFCLRVAGRLEDVLAQLEQCGVHLLEQAPVRRMGAKGWGWAAYVQDPDGYVVELKEEGQ